MQFTPNALRFCPASVGALMDTGFLRTVLHDVEEPGHPEGGPAPHAAAPAPRTALLARGRLLVQAITGSRGAPAKP